MCRIIRQHHRRGSRGRRVLAGTLCALIACCLIAPLTLCALPFGSQHSAGPSVCAVKPGTDLEVRVGYWGDDKDYRTKAVLSRDELESIGTQVYVFANVTRVGTVMETIARGPTILGVLEAAGIDAGSVQTINLRTTDRYDVENNWFVSLNMDQWVNATRYYYPYLRSNYERVEDEEGSVDPEEGGLAEGGVRASSRGLRGRKPVPAILAIESISTKDPEEVIDASMMNEENSYRFCSGQTLMEPDVVCKDVSSMNSAQWVFGIDVTLYGTPEEATGLELSLSQTKMKVGSKKQIGYRVLGQDLFDDKVNGIVTAS